MTNDKMKPLYQRYDSEPVVSFAFPKHDAKATSNKPAITKMIQFIVKNFTGAKVLFALGKTFYKC